LLVENTSIPMTDEKMTTIKREHEIVNEKGLHARASAKFVETVDMYEADADVWHNDMHATGDSIMSLLMLAASYGTRIIIETKGAQATELADALEDLIADRFGEEC